MIKLDVSGYRADEVLESLSELRAKSYWYESSDGSKTLTGEIGKPVFCPSLNIVQFTIMKEQLNHLLKN